MRKMCAVRGTPLGGCPDSDAEVTLATRLRAAQCAAMLKQAMSKVGMLQSARVRDVMTEAVVYLQSETPASEAAEILTRHRINGAPVLGHHGHVVGLVSKTDLLDARREPADREMLVSDAMTRVVFAVRTNDPVMLAVRLMVEEEIHRAVVVNDDGTLAGIVAPMDILRAMLSGLRVEAPDEEPLFVDLESLRNR